MSSLKRQFKVTGKRQFIAGVSCPKCQALDKIVTFPVIRFLEESGVEMQDEMMACVACSYEVSKSDLLQIGQESQPKSANTRPIKISSST